MIFSSINFIFYFLPIFLLAYFLTPDKYKNITLLFGSLFFYAYGEPVYVFLMLGSIVLNYGLALWMKHVTYPKDSESVPSKRKWILVLALVINLGALFLFKYINFFTSTIRPIVPVHLPQVNLTLPLGISFYTFQIISYLIDVYRNKYPAEQSFTSFAAYVCMFPQLIAGPIVNYNEVKESLKKRKLNMNDIEWGITIFILGLSYKVLLANKIASLWNTVQSAGVLGINAPTAWLGSWGYSMQLFFDFFGYSLMAIGLGKILGFDFPANFVNPYCATSATDFWRKWHITLGRWFKEYVYIPLGGNRAGFGKTIRNTFIVWALTGLWHGASWNFILWGILFFVLITLEKRIYLRKLEKHKLFGHIYMLFVIPVSWTIFNITDLPYLGKYLLRMAGCSLKGEMLGNAMTKFYGLLETYWWLLIICIFCCTGIPMKLLKKYHHTFICKLCMFILFLLSIYQIKQGFNNPFLYFRF